MNEKILIIDDEETLCYFLKESLEEKGYQAVAAHTAQEGLEVVTRQQVDLVLLDLRLPDGDGLSVLYEIKKADSDLPVIVLTGHAAVESAVQAMKLGAYDYLEKPINLAELSLTAAKALESQAMRREIQRLRLQQDRDHELIVGEPLETFRFLSLSPVVCIVASDKIVKVARLEWALFQGEVLIGAKIVNP